MLGKLTLNKTFLKPYVLKNFAEKIKIKKDYYQILGIPKSATEDEIKQSYRNLAKLYHPDVNVGSETKEQTGDKFRDVAEAYAVLSNKTLRLDYDTRMRHFPDIVYNAEKMKKMKENEVQRDGTGNAIKPAPMKGSYAEYRLEKLKEMRRQFNVDDNGFYKGGVPRKGNGEVRGNANGPHGFYHNPWDHNENAHDLPHIRDHVSTKEAQDHKIFMNSSRTGYQRFRPYFKMDEIEQDSQYYVDSEHRRLFVNKN